MSDTAVLVVDMMNSFQHPDAEPLIPNVGKVIDPLADLVHRAHESDDVDLFYVNDNYGDFTAEFSDIVRSALDGARPDLVKPILPAEGSRLLTKVRPWADAPARARLKCRLCRRVAVQTRTLARGLNQYSRTGDRPLRRIA
jgi:nicotinamidase-related amidase